LNPNTILGGLWNGMVAPVMPFGAKGFIWWQGEANSDRTSDYRVRFPALIEDWRRQWRLPQAPWIFVELANFGERYGSMMEDAPWPALRDAQKSALSYPEVYRVSAIDILEKPTWEIHPPNKAQTGHRLFLAALANVYGHRSTAWSGPDVQAIEFEASQCLVTLKDSKGLRTRDGKDVRGFVLSGSDRQWYPAEATIRGHQIVVKCKEVLQPVAVRYAWMNNPDVNLENEAGLPAWPFRSDCWNLGE
jgi:sialate O-acetylesterase